MKVEDIIKKIALSGEEDWKCFDTLKVLLNSNEEFRKVISEGISTKEITGFGEELWEKLDKQNMRSSEINSLLEVFRDGHNQGRCTVMAKQVSYSLNNCYICGGELPILKGTVNCPDGSHTWIEHKGYIIDTTLMLCINNNLVKEIGYIEQNKIDPTKDPLYVVAKETANDPNLRPKKM